MLGTYTLQHYNTRGITMSNEANTTVPASTKSKAKKDDFATQVASWKKSATSARNRSGELLYRALETLPQGNVDRINLLLAALVEVKAYQHDAFVSFVLYVTGGGYSVDGKRFLQPEKSILSFNVKEVRFSIKRTKGDAEATAAKEQALAQAQAKCGLAGAWWELATEKPANPYKIDSLLGAIKKANKEAENLLPADRAMLQSILAAAEAAGYSDKVAVAK